jgi:FkbM family methyltransferase
MFVEVGAFDGESFSNTSGLADIGWRGHYVEPVKSFFEACRLRHSRNNVDVHNLAISDQAGSIELNVGSALSTASTETFYAYREMPWACQTEFLGEKSVVQALTLDAFLTSISASLGFDLLVVDVEGLEEKVFLGFSLKKWKPKMIIVELNDYHDSFSGHPNLQDSSRRVRKLIIDHGYMQTYCDEINTIFVLPRTMVSARET